MRHLLALRELAVDGGIGRPAAHGEIVGRGDHRAAFDVGAAEDQVGGIEVGELACGIVMPLAGDLANLAERTRIDQPGNSRARIELAARVLPRDLFGAAHPLGQCLAAAQFVDFGLPGHRALPLPMWHARSRRERPYAARRIALKASAIGSGWPK